MSNRPPIPLRCLHLGRVAGLAVPWITTQDEPMFAGALMPARRAVFGGVSRERRDHVVLHRLCQVCGRGLERRAVYIVRPVDVAEGWTAEPALHPECAGYAAKACPILSGEKSHYRASPLVMDRLVDDWSQTHGPKESQHDGAPVHEYNTWLVDMSQYAVADDKDRPGEILGLALKDVQPLKVRLLRRSTQEVEAAPFLDALGRLFGGDGPEAS
ncbi:hypothetical protein [Streptomyces sp. NRRL S-350]|uniref:hypothetical protein n=1 Tax=Streptomyces sp. NRRL S-350 TaxID=1463902 RepID=UPI000689543A|nr:hypothetical protein [Streptomyces sp. NRRL S-350]